MAIAAHSIAANSPKASDQPASGLPLDGRNPVPCPKVTSREHGPAFFAGREDARPKGEGSSNESRIVQQTALPAPEVQRPDQPPSDNFKQKERMGSQQGKAERNAAVVKIIRPEHKLPNDLSVKPFEAAVSNVKAQGNSARSFDSLLTLAVNDKDAARVGLLLSMRSEVLGWWHAKQLKGLDSAIAAAARQEDSTLLSALLDAHPHAGGDPADRSAGTLILNFFRHVGSLFGGAAVVWQGKQAIGLINGAARAGNTASMTMLLNRGIDLVQDEAAPKLRHALELAVSSGNADTTRVLLENVLQRDPDYRNSAFLTTMAAHQQDANILEILVTNGMALPPASNWSGYTVPIKDYLCRETADNLSAKGKRPVGQTLPLDPARKKSMHSTPAQQVDQALDDGASPRTHRDAFRPEAASGG